MNPRLIFSLTSLVAGIIAGSTVSVTGEFNLLSLLGLILITINFFIWIFMLLRSEGYLIKGWWFYCLLFAITGYVLVSLEKPDMRVPKEGFCKVIGKVAEVKVVSDKMIQVVIEGKCLQVDTTIKKCKGRIVMLCKPDRDTTKPGEIREYGPVRISAIRRVKSDRGFRSDLYWKSRGVLYEAWVYPGQMRLLAPSRTRGIRQIMIAWQDQLVNHIEHVGLTRNSTALLAAMLLGDRKQLNKEVVKDFSQAGIVHVLSVSGLHIGIIFLVINWLIKKVVFFPLLVRQMVGILCIWGYTGLTGFSPSACRAAGMISLFLISGLIGRNLKGIEVLAATALLHCLINPWVVYSCGAQLSYLAVAGIFIWMPLMPKGATNKWLSRKIAESCGVSLSAQSLLLPVLLSWFGWFPLYFLIGNLVLMPVLVACFYLGALFLFADLIGINAGIAHFLVDAPIDLCIKGAEFLGRLPGNEIRLTPPGPSGIMLYYGLLIFLITYLRSPLVHKWKSFLIVFGMIGIIDIATILLERIT